MLAALVESLGALVGITEDPVFDAVFMGGIGYALSTVAGTMMLDNMLASYGGKSSSAMFGLELDSRFGWWLMELPATLSFNYFYWSGPNAFLPAPLFCAFLFNKHYLNRGWFFPLAIRKAPGTKQSFSITVLLAGMLFTAMHGYLNATWFSKLGHNLESTSWFTSPWFLIGYPLYEIAFLFTLNCELTMRNLRAPQEGHFDLSNTIYSFVSPNLCVTPEKPAPAGAKKAKQYKIPYGGGFELVTNPQYFGELVGWFAWILWSENPGGIIVFLVSAANLIPRAFAQHQWYCEKFEDYPKQRKVIVPYLM